MIVKILNGVPATPNGERDRREWMHVLARLKGARRRLEGFANLAPMKGLISAGGATYCWLLVPTPHAWVCIERRHAY